MIARPLAIGGPRLGPLAYTVAARQLALLGRRATQSSLEHGRSRRAARPQRAQCCLLDILLELHFFRSLFAFPRTFSPSPPSLPSAWQRHQAASLTKLAFTAGAGYSAAARS